MTLASIHRRPILSLAAPAAEKSSLWCIILAGGEDGCLHPRVDHRPGESRPRQYSTFVGSRSMFQHTLDRARLIVPENHIVSIIGRGHSKFLRFAVNGPLPGKVVEEPHNLGTAPGIFLALAHILVKDPEAHVVIFPSDHFVYPEIRFVRHAIRACELTKTHPTV